MSAPWEVFRQSSKKNTKGNWVRMPKVRYLRADLTCGECGRERCGEKQNYVAKKGQSLGTHWTCPRNGQGSTNVMSHYSACMAFVPREQK
jgi:hypothetical protein